MIQILHAAFAVYATVAVCIALATAHGSNVEKSNW